MNRKSDLRVMVMEGMEMVTKFLHLSSTSGTTTLLTFSLYAYLLILACGISVGEKGFIYGCYCGIPRLDGKTSMYQ